MPNLASDVLTSRLTLAEVVFWTCNYDTTTFDLPSRRSLVRTVLVFSVPYPAGLIFEETAS